MNSDKIYAMILRIIISVVINSNKWCIICINSVADRNVVHVD